MKRIILIAAVALSAAQVAATYAQSVDNDQDRSHPGALVEDATITTKIKAGLAAQHVGSLVHIRVDTADHGVVTLTGKANSQEAIDAAVSIARATEGVREVHSDIRLSDDK
jgi:hyperosmotically inducible periplasmic protein